MKIRTLLAGLAVVAFGIGAVAPANASVEAAQNSQAAFCWTCWDPM